jgi:hypothetical protein
VQPIQELHGTRTARWGGTVLRGEPLEDGPADDVSARRRCCLALLTLLDARPPGTDFAGTVVQREEIQQIIEHDSPSTLYATFGVRSRNSLAAALEGGDGPGPAGRRDIVDHLVAEAKVWSFLPSRGGWLDELERDVHLEGRLVAETLVRTVADWASRNPRVAALGGHAPPLSAVEDLRTVSVGRPTWAELTALLSDVIALAVGPRGTSPRDVLSLAHTELMAIPGFLGSAYLDETLRALTRSLGEIEYLLPKLDSGEWERVAGILSPRLADVLRALSTGDRS